MLRFLRRDRFAPHQPLERERREVAFAVSTGRPDDDSAQAESAERPEPLEGTRQDEPENAVTQTRRSVDSVLQTESIETLSQSRAVLDALRDIAHPSATIEAHLKRIEGMHEAEDRSAAIAEALKESSVQIAVLRSLQEQSDRYQSLVTSIEQSNEGDEKGDILKRSDAAAQIRALASAHASDGSVERWIEQASPSELRKLLGVEEKAAGWRKAVVLFHDLWKCMSFKNNEWIDSEGELPEDEQKRRQENYFKAVGRSIESLKQHLKRSLDARAESISTAITTEMQQGLAEIAGVNVGDLRIVDASQWSTTHSATFEKAHGITIEDALEECNAMANHAVTAKDLSADAPSFVADATSLLAAMEEDETQRNIDGGIWKHAIVEAKKRHESVGVWAVQYIEQYKRLKPRLSEASVRHFLMMATGATSEQEVVQRLSELAEDLQNPDAQVRSNLSFLRATTQRLLPVMEGALSRDYQSLFAVEKTAATPLECEESASEAMQKTRDAEELLKRSPILTSVACRALHIPSNLQRIIDSARNDILRAEKSYQAIHAQLRDITGQDQASKERRVALQTSLRSASAHISIVSSHMSELMKGLTFITKNINGTAKDTDEDCKGYCHYGEATIFVNREKHRNPPPSGPIDENEVRRTADHEFGHLVVDALTERTHVLTAAFSEQQNAFVEEAEKKNGSSKTEDLLEKAARQWGLDRAAIVKDGDAIHASGGGEGYYRRKRWEELLMQYATYCSKREELGADYNLDADPAFTAETKELLQMLDRQRSPEGMSTAEDVFAKRSAVAYMSSATGTPDPDEDDGGGNEKKPLIEDFKKLRQRIQFVDTFCHTYPEAEKSWIGSALEQAKNHYEIYFRQYDKHEDADGNQLPDSYDPETDETLRDNIKNENDRLRKIQEIISKHDSENMASVSDATPKGKEFWLWVTRDIQWLSIMDYWTIAKEGWEDLSRLWKRRGEYARGKVGEMLTGWIGDRVPYFGQLKHEFHRRQQDSELSAVEVWKKALSNVDSYKLIEQIEHANNPDHLKAIIILLTERGRVDWDDPILWRTLSRFSHFKIPEHECHRDPILLDKWLQKVVTDIWADKDLFRKWHTSNEHSYDSERDKYNGIADKYSATSNLKPQLKYLLETFVKVQRRRENGEDVPMPDQVNPHLYEKLFLYAMENGKMRMQDKFFYLVQGIRYKLIPLDRLSILQGKVSMDGFPFIDFFYQQNNTMQDVIEIGESITEDPPKSPFEPGLKSYAFLMEEVARDESTRARVSKFMDRKGDQLDHEDVPMFVSFVGYEDMNNMLQPMGGARQRFTKEGIKNAYVGYNTLFKVNAMRIKKMLEDGQRPSSDDLQYLVSRLVTYVHFNNVVLRDAAEVAGRPSLGYEAYENSTMPSAYTGLKPKDYGKPMNVLVDRLVHAYGITVPPDSENKILDINEYLGKDAGTAEGVRNRSSFRKGSDAAKNIFEASKRMYEAMIKAVSRDNGAELINVLTGMDMDFLNEGQEQFTYSEMQDKVNRAKSRYARASSGGGHGGHP
jgi:hypothetical protein